MAIIDNITDLYNAMRPLILSDVASTVVQTGSSASSSSVSSGAPVDGQYLVLSANGTLTNERAFTLAANSGLSGTDGGAGSTYTLALGTPSTLTVSSTNALSGSNHTHAITSSSSPGAAASILASDASGILTLPQFTASTKVRTPLIDTASGALTLTPATGVTLTDGKTFNGSGTFTSGFAGSGWRLDQGVAYASQSTLELDNVIVRGLMRVYELVINKIRVSRGSLIVSPGGGKVASVSGSGPYTLTFDDDHGVLTNDLLRAQKFTGSGTYQSLLTVTAVPTSKTLTVTLTSGSAPAAGYEYAVVGNTSDSTRQGGLFLTADDSGAPFLDIYDGVAAHTDFNSYTKTKARLGKLTGITDSFFGTLSGYGLYTSRAYLNGAYINGSLVIGPGVGFTVAPLFYCAFDTPRQGNVVNTNGHKGQAATITGGVHGQMGKFGGAVAVGEATTNRILNPSVETNTTGYSVSGTVTLSRSTDYAMFGQYSLKYVHSSGTADVFYNVSGTLATSTTFAFSVYARKSDGSAISGVTMYIDSSLGTITPTITSVGGGWYRIYGTRTIGGSLGNHIVGLAGLGSGSTWYFDGWQVEARGYTTPYVDGSLGDGYVWTTPASPHASTSTRTAAVLAYPILRNINPLKGSVSAWILMEYYKTSTGAVIWNAGDASGEFVGQISTGGAVQLYINGNALTHGTAMSAGWHHIVYTWDIAANSMYVYLDGVASSAGTPSTTPPTLHASTIQIGGSSVIGTTYNWNGLIDDFAILDRVLTADEVQAIYSSNAPLNVTRSNYELVLSEEGYGKVVANAAGIYGTDTSSKPTFSLVNAATTVNGEALGAGDTLLGDNSSSKGNVLFDQSAGKLYIRNGTNNVITMETDATLGTAATFEGAIKLGSSGGIYQGSSGSFSSVGTGIKIWRGNGTTDGGTAGDCIIGVFDAGAYTMSITPSAAITIVGGSAFTGKRGVNFVNSAGTRLGEVYGYQGASTNVVSLRSVSYNSAYSANAYMYAGLDRDQTSGTANWYAWASRMVESSGVASLNHPYAEAYGAISRTTDTGTTGLIATGANPADRNGAAIDSAQIELKVTGGGVSTITMWTDDFNMGRGNKNFMIDHPLDPLNKWLTHATVEGDDRYTLYKGVAVLNKRGEATVKMPAWFNALNKDMTYELTCGGKFCPVYIDEEINDQGEFRIAGGEEGIKVFWTVLGTRNDPWAKNHPYIVERAKDESETGFADAWQDHGLPEEKSFRRERMRVHEKGVIEAAKQRATNPAPAGQ